MENEYAEEKNLGSNKRTKPNSHKTKYLEKQKQKEPSIIVEKQPNIVSLMRK